MIYSVLGIITIIATISLFSVYIYVRKRTKTGEFLSNIACLAVVFVSGTLLYSCAILYVGEDLTRTERLFAVAQGVQLTLASFAGGINTEILLGLGKVNFVFAAAAFINYLAAVSLTFFVVIKLFGQNLVNTIFVIINARRAKYIVVGASAQSEMFLKSLSPKQRKRTTVILQDIHSEKKKSFIEKGFAVVVIKDKSDREDKDLKGQKEILREIYVALKTAGFNRNKHCTRIIAMSDSDELNLLTAKIVTEYISDTVKPQKNADGRINKLSTEQENILSALNITAHIMYESIDRAEHFAFVEYALGKVKFFNPCELRAHKFMLENPITSLIPTEWINTSKARLKTPTERNTDTPYKVSHFFIGYGDTNRHLLKKSICNYQLMGIDYNSLVVDAKADILEEQFKNSAIGLYCDVDEGGRIVYGSELKKSDQAIYYPNPVDKFNIQFAKLNIMSLEFCNKIFSEIEGSGNNNPCDFVTITIALASDKQSVETALELRQRLYERRLLTNGQNRRVRIFVKTDKKSILSDYNLLNDKNDIKSEIIVFGAAEDILNEEYIIGGGLDFLARRIANDYWKVADERTNTVTKWDSLTEFKRDSNRNAAMGIAVKLNLLGFELVKNGVATQQSVIDAYNKAYGMEISNALRKQKEKGFVDFAERDQNGNILDTPRNNLARLEHQRWNAFHLMHGWKKLAIDEVTADRRQDEKAKQHACITTFEGLTDLRNRQAKLAGGDLDAALNNADTVCYDYDVMDRLFANLSNSDYSVKLINSKN